MSYTKVGPDKYRIFISDGTNLDGSRRRFSKTVTINLAGRDLKRFLMEAEFDFEDEVKRKDPRFQELAKGTFEGYSNWWLEYKKNHEGVLAKTLEPYTSFLNNRILKYIGGKILDKITNGDMLELMETIKNSPAKSKTGRLSVKSVKHHHTLLKAMFNDAVKLKILNESPMDNVPVKTPPIKLKDNYYNLEDVDKLMGLLSVEPIRYQLAAILAITTGFRPGELSALQWGHIDYTNMQIKIEQANSYTPAEGSVIKSTKNKHSERTVAFPRLLINLLEQHKKDEVLKKELVGENWYYGESDHEEDFVFTQKNGKIIFANTISRWFRKLILKHNLKYITLNGLRHTNATILINEGVNVVSVSHMLGHSNTSTTTNIYAHHLESVERKMADTFDDILKSGTGSGTHVSKLRIVK